ncbi:MAG: hypothetical protein GWO38_07840 [Phycisphaerae bacterium]|nr:hypothetical protein [Phycisphaerae bacterium]NIX27535.1 hypothetical protein [Phycisphaerae bacterium]
MNEQEQWFTDEKRETLLKERYFSGTHNYFFEVKVANNGSKYIVMAQRKKVGDKFVGVKMRIFEDEMLEFQRVLNKLIRFALDDEPSGQFAINNVRNEPKHPGSDLSPPFFDKLYSTNNWQKFEEYTYYLLKLLGIQKAYNFLEERQAGKADGFFKFGSLAVIYDCTLDGRDIEDSKREQINNYCNRLKQGSIEISSSTTEEFYTHHKQVWIVTRGTTQRIKLINNIEVKEVAVQDIMSIYQERLTMAMSDQSLETKLRHL